MMRATKMPPSRFGCAPGKPPIRSLISRLGSIGGAQRWRNELLPVAEIVIAEAGGAMVGFVTVDAKALYLDQIVVAPTHWRSGIGTALLAEARRMSPGGLDLDVNTDNAGAISFYRKEGFAITGEGKNPISGKPVYRMSWRP